MLMKELALGGSTRTVGRPLDELTLCRRIASGEHRLFAQIIDQYSGLVTGAIASRGVAREEIEDLAQTTFINVYKGIAGFRGEAKLSSWIYRIAINVARAHLKRKVTRPVEHSVEQAMDTGIHPVDHQTSAMPVHSLRNRELGQAMARLPENQRTALTLYYIEELSYEEIAEAMGLNLNTVRTHIRRGKLNLAELLDETTLVG